MACHEIEGLPPVVDPTAYVHPCAVLVGDSIGGQRFHLRPLASPRGDFGRIILVEGGKVQDNCAMHGFPGTDTRNEVDGHLGQGAVLHGRTIKSNAMVVMNAVVMDEAVVGESAIVAACALVKAAMMIPPRHIAAGVPAKVLRKPDDEETEWKRGSTRSHQALTLGSPRSLATMREVEPLSAPEPARRWPDSADRNVVPLVAPRKG